MGKTKKVEVLDREIAIRTVNDEDYICITDIGRFKDHEHSDDLIRNWVRNRNTIEFLGIWEQINNPDFNSVEFDGFCWSNWEGMSLYTGTYQAPWMGCVNG